MNRPIRQLEKLAGNGLKRHDRPTFTPYSKRSDRSICGPDRDQRDR